MPCRSWNIALKYHQISSIYFQALSKLLIKNATDIFTFDIYIKQKQENIMTTFEFEIKDVHDSLTKKRLTKCL